MCDEADGIDDFDDGYDVDDSFRAVFTRSGFYT
jgi:hypothetical protein